MTHVHLVDKQVPVYEFEEKLKFDLSVEAKTNISNLSVRAEIRSADGGSVAAGILQEFTSFLQEEAKYWKWNCCCVDLYRENISYCW